MERMSQCDKTLQLISRQGGATGMDIIRAGVLNYRGRICDLRKRGYAIRTTMTDGVNAVGEPCEYAVYSLEEEQT